MLRGGGEEGFELCEDEAGVAEEGWADGEDGDAAVVEVEGVGEEGAGELRGLDGGGVGDVAEVEVPGGALSFLFDCGEVGEGEGWMDGGGLKTKRCMRGFGTRGKSGTLEQRLESLRAGDISLMVPRLYEALETEG